MPNATPYVLYVGHYLDEAIVKERGIPTRNPAGSNRMRRLAEALRSQGQRVAIVSPAISLRVAVRSALVHPARIRPCGQVPAIFIPAVGLPLIGTLLEAFLLIGALCTIRGRHQVAAVLLYDFPPSFLAVALLVKLFWRVPLIHDLEDISVPRWRDWLPRASARPVQQLVGFLSMMCIIRLSDGIIIPTQRFTWVIPAHKPRLLISGCMPPLPDAGEQHSPGSAGLPLRILYAGSIEPEHGIQQLLHALELLSKYPALVSRLEVDICGAGSRATWVGRYVEQMPAMKVRFRGFVSDEEYRHLLSEADVCLALQDPQGRYGSTNTPSKVYEFLGCGKMVIGTDVGDLGLLPQDVITICRPFDAQALCHLIQKIAQDPGIARCRGASAARYARQHFTYPKVGEIMCAFIQHPNRAHAQERGAHSA